MLTTFSGGRLFGDRTGSEPADVLALHGWRRDRSDFRLATEGLDAVALDLPGFGASPAPEAAMGAAGYAALVAPLLDELADRVVVVGHSFGGRVACHLAVSRPERISGLVLTGVPLLHRADRTTSTPSLGYRLTRWAHRRGLMSDDRMEALRRSRGSDDYRAATGVMRDVLVTVVNEEYGELLPRIDVPVELVWARRDDAAPLEVAQRAQGRFPDAHLTILDEPAHHDLPLVAAEELRDAIERVRERAAR
ncbi:MAG: alpha/beta hydrolase [Actinomycetota bacterium]